VKNTRAKAFTLVRIVSTMGSGSLQMAIPASSAPKIRLTPARLARATMAKQASKAKRAGRCSTSPRAGECRAARSSRGRLHMTAAKKATVSTGVSTSSATDGDSDSARAVATPTRPHRAMSSTVAMVRTIRAKRVFMIPRSMKIFEITGMEVMATAMPMTITREASLPRAPM
jgi:hypothetical protein